MLEIVEDSYWVPEYQSLRSSDWVESGVRYETKEDAESYNTWRQSLNDLKRRVTKITMRKEHYD